jgi:WD40 repeat protein
VAFSPDGRLIVSAGGDQVVKVWNAQTGTELRGLRGHNDWVSSVAFSNDGRFIISAGVDRAVKVWEYQADEGSAGAGHTQKLNGLAISFDGKKIATASDDATVKIWDLNGGAELLTLLGHAEPATAVAFSPDGTRVVTGANDRRLKLWDAATGRELQSLDAVDRVPMLAYASDGSRFVAWYSKSYGENPRGAVIQSYDPTGKVLDTLAEDRGRRVDCLVMSPDGELVASGSPDGSVRIWKLSSKERLTGDIPAHAKAMGDLAFTPDKRKLVTGDADGEIKVWDLAKREVLKTFHAFTKDLSGIVVSPDGKRFLTWSGTGEVKLFETEGESGKELRKWDLRLPIRAIVFTPDGKKAVTANGDATLFVLEMP